MKDFFELKTNLKKDHSDHKPLRAALLGDTSTQLMHQALVATAYDYGFRLQMYEAGIDQLELQVFDPSSELYAFEPEVIILHHSSEKLQELYAKTNPGERHCLADTRLQVIRQMHEAIRARSGAAIIYLNYPELSDAVFGSFANHIPSSFNWQLRKLNVTLMDYASSHAGIFICDVQAIQNMLGRRTFFHAPTYVNATMVFSIEALPFIAARIMDLTAALQGQLKKCVVLDLDNTLWGGIIGDDGLENIQVGDLGVGKAFSDFQHWLKLLKERGIILAVCSKNTEAIAREPFLKHPDMVLKLEDFAVFVANWESKVDNIRAIQQALHIGFDSMVFIDDNPFERELVRSELPHITVPELPEDPTEYIGFLNSENLFETVSFSNEDRHRTAQYQVEAERLNLSHRVGTETEFLKQLGMVSTVEPLTAFNKPRVAQLSQRSNQFNLRTIRYTEAELDNLMASGAHHLFAFGLKDRFGDYGLIAVVILEEQHDALFITSWFMSCRVLRRGMEQFTLNRLVEFAGQKGFRLLRGEYLPTAKNELVKNHYRDLGFKPLGDQWQLDLQIYQTKETFITPQPQHEFGTNRTI